MATQNEKNVRKNMAIADALNESWVDGSYLEHDAEQFHRHLIKLGYLIVSL